MSNKYKNKEFHFNLGVLSRWIFFALIVYFSINYLSNNKSSLNTSLNTQNVNVLGVNSEPIMANFTQAFEDYKKQAINFTNNRFIDISKQAITKLYEEIIKKIDKSKK